MRRQPSVIVQAVTLKLTEPLRIAIEELYRVFEPWVRPESFLGCGCCCSGERMPDESLFNFANGTVRITAPGGDTPLRVRTTEALVDFAFNA